MQFTQITTQCVAKVVATKVFPGIKPCSESMIELTDGWKRGNFKFETINWRKSKHAQHLIVHKDDYLNSFNSYLSEVLKK